MKQPDSERMYVCQVKTGYQTPKGVELRWKKTEVELTGDADHIQCAHCSVGRQRLCCLRCHSRLRFSARDVLRCISSLGLPKTVSTGPHHLLGEGQPHLETAVVAMPPLSLEGKKPRAV
jgi:hypothetical protein